MLAHNKSWLLCALTSTVVALIGLLIFACRVRLNGLLDRLDGPAQEVGVAHPRAVAGLHAAAVNSGGYVRVARVRSKAEAWCNGGGAVGAGQHEGARACLCLLLAVARAGYVGDRLLGIRDSRIAVGEKPGE
jgi:hypothetical protein